MDEDELFDVFSKKDDNRSDGHKKVGEEEAGKRKRGDNEDKVVREEEKEDEDEEEEDEKPSETKKSKRNDDVKLCPVTGEGSVKIFDITPEGQESGRKACRHHIAIPPCMTLEEAQKPVAPKPPAKEYKFQLDPFQAAAVKSLEKGQSVLVSAHTSAGKTAVAEYAIAMALRDKQRVVYTSPIKALSNQKFRELTDEFQDVGLMTGDITINPEASLLVMTTEILRSMLYKGSELIRELVWIIYDEIHYMRDRERGVVWEESIVLVPSKIRFVFLSATIPNAPDFACWVSRVHSQPCNVIYTDYRPTPLQHYMFPAGGDGLYLVVDEDGNFREENFHKALARLDTSAANTEIAARKKGGSGSKGKIKERGGSDIYKIIKMIMEKNYDPVIVFCFSKKDCEALALQMSKLDFNNDDEKANIDMIFNSAIDSLSADDRKIPAVEGILPLLKRGIGIHHSGLLPILKEVIEILFQEGLIKCLCATETFSMGLNMPAKTCVFTGVRKWDGESFRWVSGGEYIQMSGRAGRRGLDDRGIVILMVDEKMEPDVAKGMVKGQSDPLNSSFRLGYNMLLNLLRFEGADPEFLIKRSFYQFQMDKQAPDLKGQIEDLEVERRQLVVADEPLVAEYHELVTQRSKVEEEMRSYVLSPKVAVNFLNPGRFVECFSDETHGASWGWGVLVSFKKAEKEKSGAPGSAYLLDLLLPCSTRKTIILPTGKEMAVGDNDSFLPPREGEKHEIQVVQLPLSMVKSLSSIRVYVPQDLRSAENRRSVGKTMAVVQERFPDGIPLLDPVEDMQIKEEEFLRLVRKGESLETKVKQHKVHKGSSKYAKAYESYKRKLAIASNIAVLQKSMKGASGMVFRSELKGMKRVLRRLKYTDSDDVVQIKGRAAAEIDCGDELVLTELIFEGVFNDLAPE
eukprot:138374-Hanusia_phi.AAC.1